MLKNKTLLGVMVGAFLLVAPILSPLMHVNAASKNLICTVFPFIENIKAFGVSNLCTGLSAKATGDTIRSTFNLIVSLIFVAIIIFSIYVIIRAAIKYIRSEGDPAKIEEAQKAIKSVFIGIAALFVGLIGIIIIIAFFGATEAVGTTDVNDSVNPLLNSILK